jgi:iron(III) transport system substrate-binding protein
MNKLFGLATIGFLACFAFYLSRQLPNSQTEDFDSNTVTIYTALDKVFSEPLLKAFTKETGIKVKPVYDSELSKTVGLVNRIVSERARPVCDVFWNNEIVRTLYLKRQGLLEAFSPKNAAGIDKQFVNSHWTGFAARARILIVNKSLLTEEEYPRTSQELLTPRFKNKFAIAKPLFGTTSTHAAVLFSWGSKEGKNYFLNMKKNGVKVADGNAMVKDDVARALIPVGWTDTDDASLAISRGKDVAIVLPDQKGRGLILIPNTLSLIKNCEHPEAGKKLIEFLLRKETEKYLAHSESAQIPLHPGVEAPANVIRIKETNIATIDWEKVADVLEESNLFIKDIFLK